jgi:hypothetical protein
VTAPVIAPASLCSAFIGARRLRVTLVDNCGRPVWGPRSQITSKGFVSIEIGPSVEEGEDYKSTSAGGELIVKDRGEDTISWYEVSCEFVQVDPDLFLLMQRTWKRVTDASRKTSTGWRQGETLSATLGYALELWPKATGTGSAQACLMGDDDVIDPTVYPTGYFLLPWVLGLAPESTTLENSPTSFKLKGRTRAGSLWGRGPYNITRDLAGAPAPLLDPIDPGFDVPAWNLTTSGDPDHWHTETVTVAPPEPVCGAQPLWNPLATTPLVTTAVNGVNTMSVRLTVTNINAVGKSGIVDWGDGTTSAIAPSDAGIATHTYAAGEADVDQEIKFMAGNGHAPVIKIFTPEE